MTKKCRTNWLINQVEGANKFSRYEEGQANHRYYNGNEQMCRIPKNKTVRESTYRVILRRLVKLGLLVFFALVAYQVFATFV